MTQAFATSADMALLGLPQSVLDRAEAKSPGSVAKAISAANARAAGYLAQRYALPLSVWGDDLREQVCALAGWRVLCVVGFNPENPADAAARAAYLDAVKWFEAVASGQAALADVVDATPDVEEFGAVVYTDAARGW